MSVADFLASADASALLLAAPALGVGARILAAAEATRAVCGQHPNLGILLLCAPLLTAAQQGGDLRAALRGVLAGLDRDDAVHAFRAIRLAAPGGLGRSARHDVAAPPEVSLLEAMRAAAARDRIARQYITGFADVFAIGVERLVQLRAADWVDDWAITGVFLAFLAAFPDTHVARKHGALVAAEVRRVASGLDLRLRTAAQPGALYADLLEWDGALKRRGINPGTAADLTVASYLAAALLRGR